MSSHGPHPDTLTNGLADNCERCRELAAMPLQGLDRDHLGAFWLKMIAVEFEDNGIYRSANEATCCRSLYLHAAFILRYLPDSVNIRVWPITVTA